MPYRYMHNDRHGFITLQLRFVCYLLSGGGGKIVGSKKEAHPSERSCTEEWPAGRITTP